METKASYLAAGIFVIATVTGLIVFLLWISQIDWTKGQKYDIYFSGSVTGLRKNEVVSYNGVPIGKVESIDINPKKVDLVHVLVKIDKPKLIRENSYATLESKGITGSLQIRILGSSRDSPSLKAKPGEEYPVIKSQTSAIQSLLDETPIIMQKISHILDDIRPVFTKENIASLTDSLKNLDEFTGSLAQQKAQIDVFFKNANQTLDTLRKAGGSVDTAMGQFDKFFVDNGPYIYKFTKTGLQNTSDLINHLNELSKTIEQIAVKIDRNPMQFLVPSTTKGETLPQ